MLKLIYKCRIPCIASEWHISMERIDEKTKKRKYSERSMHQHAATEGLMIESMAAGQPEKKTSLYRNTTEINKIKFIDATRSM